jgi:chitinase
MQGFACTGDGQTFNLTIPGPQLALGFPASPSGAGSGYQQPATVAALFRALQAAGTPVGGIMAWSIGWDQQAGWAFADAIASG